MLFRLFACETLFLNLLFGVGSCLALRILSCSRLQASHTLVSLRQCICEAMRTDASWRTLWVIISRSSQKTASSRVLEVTSNPNCFPSTKGTVVLRCHAPWRKGSNSHAGSPLPTPLVIWVVSNAARAVRAAFACPGTTAFSGSKQQKHTDDQHICEYPFLMETSSTVLLF